MLLAGAGKVDDDGFERQGRGSGKAWGAASKSEAPTAARPNAWAQGNASVRVRHLLGLLRCLTDIVQY